MTSLLRDNTLQPGHETCHKSSWGLEISDLRSSLCRGGFDTVVFYKELNGLQSPWSTLGDRVRNRLLLKSGLIFKKGKREDRLFRSFYFADSCPLSLETEYTVWVRELGVLLESFTIGVICTLFWIGIYN